MEIFLEPVNCSLVHLLSFIWKFLVTFSISRASFVRLENSEHILRLIVLFHIPEQAVQVGEIDSVLDLSTESQEKCLAIHLCHLGASDCAIFVIAKHDRDLSNKLIN